MASSDKDKSSQQVKEKKEMESKLKKQESDFAKL
jgi:hypothetical protein